MKTHINLKQLKLGETKIIRSKDFADKVKPKSEIGILFGNNQMTGMIYQGHINKKIFIFTPIE